jgi:hypothetical protein
MARRNDVKNGPECTVPTIIPTLRIIITLLPIIFFGSTACAQLVTVEYLYGRNGKPIEKGERVWVYFNNETGRHIFDVHTDRLGKVQFDTNGAKTFEVTLVGFIGCGEQPLGFPAKDYATDDILKTGLLTKNNCGRMNTEPIRGMLLYFVRRLHWWEWLKD